MEAVLDHMARSTSHMPALANASSRRGKKKKILPLPQGETDMQLMICEHDC